MLKPNLPRGKDGKLRISMR